MEAPAKRDSCGIDRREGCEASRSVSRNLQPYIGIDSKDTLVLVLPRVSVAWRGNSVPHTNPTSLYKSSFFL